MRLNLRLHRWLGLTVGAVLALSGLTGALLVFGHDIERALDPALHRVPPAAVSASLDAALAEVRQLHPGHAVSYIRFPRAADGTYEFWLERAFGPRVYVDPGSGRLLGSRKPHEGLVGFIRELHVHLLAGRAGDTLVGTVGIAALALFAAGAVFWWRSRRGRAALRPAAASLHRKLALYCVAFLLIAALTGTSLAFSGFLRDALNTVAGVSPALPPSAQLAVTPQVDASLAAARSALPAGRVTWVYLPAALGAPLTVRLRTPGEHHPNGLNMVYADPVSGAVLRVDPASQAGPGIRIFEWLYPLHIGTLAAEPHRAVQTLVGLLPVLLLASGVLTYLRRRSALSSSRTHHYASHSASRPDSQPNPDSRKEKKVEAEQGARS